MNRLRTEDDNLISANTARPLKSRHGSTRIENTEIERIIDYAKASGKLTLKRKINNLLTETKLGSFLDVTNSVLSLLVVAQYIAAQYTTAFEGNLEWGVFSFLVHILFLIEYMLRLYSAKEPRKYFFSLEESFVDLISNVPFFIIRFASGNPFVDQPDSLTAHTANVFSLFRILRLQKLNRYIEAEVSKQLSNIIIVITTLILFAAGAFNLVQQALENAGIVPSVQYSETKDFNFWRYVYFIITTISTLGYDNPFSTAVARIMLICLILISLAIIPAKSGELIGILSSKSVYARARYKASNAIPHILITGTVSDTALQNFLVELFHPDHGPAQKHAVILLPTRPNNHMEMVLRNSEYSSNVFYLQGMLINFFLFLD